MKPLYSLLLAAALAGCASPRQPAEEGRLPDGATYRDYSTQPFGFAIERETYEPGGELRGKRNLLTEDNFKNLQVGMTQDQVVAVVGRADSWWRRAYAGGTKSWSYRYRDGGVIKLLNVIFDANDRVASFYTEWDPSVYSKGDGKGNSSGK